MIITCNNCTKNFDVDSNLIPEKGRLLQCNNCNHKWFFKKEVINEFIEPIKINELTKEKIESKEKNEPVEIESPQSIEFLDTSVKNNLETDKKIVPNLEIKASKNGKNYNILGLTIVFIISFIALIIILDTFQVPISKVFPNIELILYNLYETIKDISLFFKDLI